MDRRTFLKRTGAGALVLSTGLPHALFAEDLLNTSAVNSIVSVITDNLAVNKDGKIDAARVKQMVEKALTLATGKEKSSDAWQKIFHDYKEGQTIGLKVNVTNLKLPTHPEVTYAITESLIAAGIKPSNILVWDKLDASFLKTGYKINDSNEGVRCFGHDHKKIGFDKNIKANIPSIGMELNLSRLLTEMSDYIINVPVLKNAVNPASANATKAGVTLSLKSAFGYIPLMDFAYLPPVEGLDPIKVIENMHARNGNPQIAELNNSPVIKGKTRFVILDGLLGLYEGGPFGPPQWINNQILASSDLVSIDTIGLNIIDKKASELGKPLSSPFAGHIASAAKLGLGINDIERITVREYAIV